MRIPGKEALTMTNVLEVQWTDCPEEVIEVVKKAWQWLEYGNDNYYWSTSIEDLVEHQVEDPDYGMDFDLKPLIDYLRNKGVEEKEQVLIHWWW